MFSPDVPFFVVNALFFDIDDDKEPVLDKFKRIVPVNVETAMSGSWRKADREYFSNHPTEFSYARESTRDERQQILKMIVESGEQFREALESEHPLFEKVLVVNLSPGFRARINIDRFDRQIKHAFFMTAWLIPEENIPQLVKVSYMLEQLTKAWQQALREADQ